MPADRNEDFYCEVWGAAGARGPRRLTEPEVTGRFRSSRHAAAAYAAAVPWRPSPDDPEGWILVGLHTHDSGAKSGVYGRNRVPVRTYFYRRYQPDRPNPNPKRGSFGLWSAIEEPA